MKEELVSKIASSKNTQKIKDGINTVNEFKENFDTKKEIDEEENSSNQSDQEITNTQKNAKNNNVKKSGNNSSKPSATRRTQNVAATAIGGYFGGEKGAELANAASKSRVGDAVSNQLEKNKAVSLISEKAEESGALDATEGVIEGALKAKSGDIKGTVESGKQAIQGVKKIAKKMMIRKFAIVFIALGLFFILFFIIASPVLQGYMQLSDTFNWLIPSGDVSDDGDEDNPGGSGTDPYSGYIPEVSTDEKESLSKSSKSEKLNYLFPNGIPTNSAEMQKYLTTITVDILNESGVHSTMSLTVHKKLAANFKGAFEDLYKAGFKIKASSTGAYNWKTVSGTNKLSQHSYGAAIDINWNDNPVCNTKSVPCGAYNPGVNPYSITRSVANILESHGLKWGLWTGSSYPNGVKYDYMHFSYTGG